MRRVRRGRTWPHIPWRGALVPGKGPEQKVLEDLSQLKAQMRWLVGNGHPGKLKELEDRVERHEQFVNRVGGISAFLATVITLLHVGMDYLRVNR